MVAARAPVDMGKQVTIEDVAQAAGCSKTAASYALRDHPKVSAARRRTIKRVARELGYTPDPQIAKLMVHLRSRRTQTFRGKLAFINTHENDRSFTQRTPALREIYFNAAERAHDLGYEFEAHWLHEPGISPARLADILEARGIRGIILGSTGKPAGPLAFEWRNFAVVTAGYSIVHPGVHRVVSHYYRNALLALRRLSELGHRRIGMVVFADQESIMDHTNLAAFSVHHNGILARERVPPLVLDNDNPRQIRAWFEKYLPDAVLSSRESVLKTLVAAGVQVPKAASFATFLLWDAAGRIAGVQPGYERLGAAAVDLLASELMHDHSDSPPNPGIVVVEGAWADGTSVRQR